MQTIEINGKEYELTDNPTHGIVRDIKKFQKKLSMGFLLKYKDTIASFKPNTPIQEAMVQIAEIDPEGMAEYNEDMEDFFEISIISLATGKLWKREDFYNMKEKEFKSILDSCKEVVGSDAEGFFGISITSSPQTESEMNNEPIQEQPC